METKLNKQKKKTDKERMLKQTRKKTGQKAPCDREV